MSASYFMLKMLKKKRDKMLHSRSENNEIFDNTSSHREDDQKTCRICLKDGYIPIYSTQSKYDLPAAIRSFGNIEFYSDDEFPKYLCDACQSLLNAAILFRKSAQESDKILHSIPLNNINTFTAIEDDSNHSLAEEYGHSSKKNIHQCMTCNVQFLSMEEYNIHKSRKHHRNIRIQCPICHRLLTPQLYKRHISRHQSASHLVCDVCGKLYRKDNLVRHLQLHSYELPFQCQVCPYRGRFMESLKIHMRTHSGEKPFSCDKCELKFITRSNLNRHLLTHKKDKPNKCVECGRGFYTKRDMDLHFKADHAGTKDFCCRICGNKYATKKAIMRHELRVHKRDKMAKGRIPLYLQEEYKKNNM